MKGNRQIGLDGRVFISDCLSDGIFFIYSIMFSGVLASVGDILKLVGKSSYSMDALTNGLIIMDLICCLGLILVSYYIYFVNCGENMPRLGVKPLIWLEYARLAYYGMLIYDILYRFCNEILHTGVYPVAMSVFYFVYLAWLVSCAFASMFILTVLNQNMIRRSYSDSFKMLALIGLGINIVMPLVFFITKIWIKGGGDGFYSSGLCDFIRLGIAPIFYAGIWFLFLNAIDQVDRVFAEVDNAIRDKNYRIEFEEEELSQKEAKKAEKEAKAEISGKKKGGKGRKSKAKKKERAEMQDKSAAEDAGSVQTDDDSGVSPEIAFKTVFDVSPSADSSDEVQDGDNGDDVGEVVDINAFLEKTGESHEHTSGEETAFTGGQSDEAQPEKNGAVIE